MEGTTVLRGSTRTGGARGRGRRVVPGRRRQVEVSVSLVVKLMQRWRRRGTVVPDRYGGWKRSPLAGHADRVLALVTETPDLTLEELRWQLAASGIRTSRSALGRLLQTRD